jgi:hypothetical protein
MFSVNLKLVTYWSFLLIFDTVSHKINGSDKKEIQNKTDDQNGSSIFKVDKREVQFFLWAKENFPKILFASSLSLSSLFLP